MISLKVYIYTLPIITLIIIVLFTTVVWCWLEKMLEAKGDKFTIFCFQIIMLIFSIAVVCSFTLANRSQTEVIDKIRMCPFYPIIFQEIYTEYFRTLFMNVLLFYPFGLALSFTRKKQSINDTCIVTIGGFLLSLVVEYLQYRFSIGIFEMDDLICNTFGTFLGGVIYVIYLKAKVRFGE